MYISKIRFIIIIIFLLSGCPYESIVPLSDPASAQIDRNLIGRWTKAEKDDKGTLIIDQFDEHGLSVVVAEDGNKKIDRMRAFTTVIDGEKFLNVQEIKDDYDKRKWMFVSYTVSGDVMTFRTVEDDIIKKKMKSPEELFAFIKKNLKTRGLFDNDNPETLKRAKE